MPSTSPRVSWPTVTAIPGLGWGWPDCKWKWQFPNKTLQLQTSHMLNCVHRSTIAAGCISFTSILYTPFQNTVSHKIQEKGLLGAERIKDTRKYPLF